jgi:hypothetical protein
MHNSSEGVENVKNRAFMTGTGPYLLKANDQSGTCLNCHEGAGDIGPTTYHVSTPSTELPPGIPPKQLTPGGDFGWLKKDYTWLSSPTGTIVTSEGDRHGHNIVASDFLYLADKTYTAHRRSSRSIPRQDSAAQAVTTPMGNTVGTWMARSPRLGGP